MPLPWNSANKNISGKNLSNPNKNWIGVGRRGNNWIEPLRNWINTAHHAEKLALSNDFYEIKSLTEKIGTNRRLLSRKTEFEFVRPFDLIPKYRAFCKARPAEGGASEQTLSPENLKCLDWSGIMDSNHQPHGPHPCALANCANPRID